MALTKFERERLVMKKSAWLFYTAMLMIIVGVVIDLTTIFAGQGLSHGLTISLLLLSQLLTFIAAYILATQFKE
ncbi:hypothetical protein PUF88_04550 [Lactobacillaceae bacterium L1_55_11]|nr:hypothetical protein [Lactobacillaceae bacterium L1_55_11]